MRSFCLVTDGHWRGHLGRMQEKRENNFGSFDIEKLMGSVDSWITSISHCWSRKI